MSDSFLVTGARSLGLRARLMASSAPGDSSGYTDDEIVRRGLHDPGMSFIQKPFTAESLAMQDRKMLDAA
ncbi:MAG TPA: hypothetical protein VGQ98_06395 [Gemmatimonadaceae bacterium]|nr:hypothetical protein [Gemmatimonadaceae bacterium]